MGLDLFTDQQAVVTYLDGALNWQVITGGVPEAEDLVMVNGLLRPYVILRFSGGMPYLQDRALGGPRLDGAYSGVDAMSVANNDMDARKLGSKVDDLLLGYVPSTNCGPITRDWGGSLFTVISENSRPQAYISMFSYRMLYNLESA